MEYKSKLRKYLLAGGVITIIGSSSIYYVIDKIIINHLEDYCFLNNIFGESHQVNFINDNYAKDGIKAVYAESDTFCIYSAPKTVMIKVDGKEEPFLIAPNGYNKTLRGYEKTVTLEGAGGSIVILNGEYNKQFDELYEPVVSDIIRK